jgi:alpha,alpha-trehalase
MLRILRQPEANFTIVKFGSNIKGLPKGSPFLFGKCCTSVVSFIHNCFDMKSITAILLGMTLSAGLFAQQPLPPDQVFGDLFRDVQLAKVFPDSKTFVDCIPKKDPAQIVAAYKAITSNPAIRFSMKLFIEDNFEMPPAPPAFNYIQKEASAAAHIKNLWGNLKREAANTGATAKEPWKNGSLLSLPYPYIVPGGRFREIYYWDSYFTMLGLKESGETEMIENMIRNFAYLIDTYGHIPNGNRSYYLSRSQPPFFGLMIELLAGIRGHTTYWTYGAALEKEYRYWMDKTAATLHVVKMPDGSILNRYYDRDAIPRQESFTEDHELSGNIQEGAAARLNRNLRSGAESGWDFSSRWFDNPNDIRSIRVTDIIPVDLNCLLYQMESTLAKIKALTNDAKTAAVYRERAAQRQKAIEKYCWNAKAGYYFDYDVAAKKQRTNITAAGVFPLCFFNMTPAQGKAKGAAIAASLKKHLLKEGGIVTTTIKSGQQWDAPNGWAPLQWMAVWGLKRNSQDPLANEIARRWIRLNENVYANTGKMMEKYNVMDIHLEAGGGEYPSQDGFGWTNGVYLALKAMLE